MEKIISKKPINEHPHIDPVCERMARLGYAGFILDDNMQPRTINEWGKASDWTAKRKSTVERYARRICIGRKRALAYFPGEGLFEYREENCK